MDGRNVEARVEPILVPVQVFAPSIRITTHMWRWWALIAVEQHAVARAARSQIEEMVADRSHAWGELMHREATAALIAVSASAHCLDALYGSVNAIAPPPRAVAEAWTAARTKRASRIVETLKLAFDVGKSAQSWPTEFRWLFDLRDAAVHFEEADKEPVPHAVAPTNVSPENVTYSLESAKRAVDLALDVLATCSANPKPHTVEWARMTRSGIGDLLANRP
jgi:hypothetical protein